MNKKFDRDSYSSEFVKNHDIEVKICSKTFHGIVRGMIKQKRSVGAILEAMNAVILNIIAYANDGDEIFNLLQQTNPGMYQDIKQQIAEERGKLNV